MPLDDTRPSEITLHVGMPYLDFIREALPMTERHWNEVGSHRDVLKFRPDHMKYIAASNAGQLVIITARDGGKLVGYLFLVVMEHLRDRERRVMGEDIFYVDPAYRRRLIGPKMRKMADDVAKRAGVTVSRRTIKARRYITRGIPATLPGGYEISEIIYDKVFAP
ncbi:MAG: GNAT family N-acetyltransferase [Patescibacteria group bacterium]|nr:GNAT family N-acetyltransferase [Patescibacteria group bacterium]